jgi:low affinity Fe/Cu permease
MLFYQKGHLMNAIAQTCCEKHANKRGFFTRFSQHIAKVTGRPQTFIVVISALILWAASGPIFGFSDTWQLIVNTSTSIITFLMVFVIQSSQNRDTEALQLKLDELLRCTKGAHNALMDLEELNETELDEIREHYLKLATKARDEMDKAEGMETGAKLYRDDGDEERTQR